MKIESRAYADQDNARQAILVVDHPLLLARLPESHKD